ncbi:MAG TPA: apolipoprotein N-acyltransferase [Dissulfurispiraceae bacterium]|nr:apolipoprotein N-acyltransferase [Dissulfurispiraceae bacterium]
MKRQKIQIPLWVWAALGSGILLILAFPTFYLFPLAWVAFVPLLLSLYSLDNRQAFLAGFLFGIVSFFGTTYWIYHSVNHYGSIPFIPSLLLVFALCLYLALYPALFSVLFASLIKRSSLPALLIAPLFWTVCEFARSYVFTGFPWSSLGYSQYSFLPVIQIADIAGIYGVSFLVMAVNGAIVDVFLIRRRQEEKPLFPSMPTYAGWITLGFFLFITLAYGFCRLHQDRSAGSVQVAIVQGNIEQDKKWDRSFQNYVIKTYRDLSAVAAQTKPDLIVWPESAVPFVFGRDKEMTKEHVEFQKTLDSYLLFGTVLKKNQKENAYSNGAALLSKDGSLTYLYDKIHLVPFGEYVPLRPLLFFVDKLAYGIGDYVAGDNYIRAVTPFGSFATLICYESVFPGLVRKFYIRGGDFMVTITNDAWFGTTSGPYQHFSMAVFRAVENRKPMVRAANSGISGFIDSNGKIVSTTELMTRTVITGKVSLDKTMTFYTKFGDVFSFFCIACSILIFFRKYRL